MSVDVCRVSVSQLQKKKIEKLIQRSLTDEARQALETGMSLLIDDVIEATTETKIKSALQKISEIKQKARDMRTLAIDLENLLGSSTNQAKEISSYRLLSNDADWMLSARNRSVENFGWSYDVNLDQLIKLCEIGESVQTTPPVDLFLIAFYWFVLEACEFLGLSSELPSNERKGRHGGRSRSEIFPLATLMLEMCVDLAMAQIDASIINDEQKRIARKRITKYKNLSEGSQIDRLRQAKKMQDSPHLAVFVSEIEQGFHR